MWFGLAPTGSWGAVAASGERVWAGGCRRIGWARRGDVSAPADGVPRPGEARRARLRDLASYSTPFQAHVPDPVWVSEWTSLARRSTPAGSVSDADDDRYAARQGQDAESCRSA